MHTITLLKQQALKVVEKQGSRWLWSFFSTKHFYWLLAVYFVPMMTLQVIVSSVSTALFNVTMLSLLIVTIQVSINSDKFQSRIEYLSLFQYFNRAGDPLKMPMMLSKSDMAHYATFIAGIVVGVVFLGFSNHSFVYYELLAIVSFLVLCLVLLQFDLYASPLLWLVVLAKSPSWLVLFVEKMCCLLDFALPRFLISWREPYWTIPLFGELGFDISVITVLQVTLHLCVLGFTRWRSNLGPHVLFFGWLVLCRNFIASSSAVHLMVIATSAVLLPFYAISFFLSPFYFAYNYGLTSPFFYSVASVGLMAAFAALVVLVFEHRRAWWMNLSIEYVVLLCLAAFIGLVMFLSGWYVSIFQVAEPLPSVSLEEYWEYCGRGNWVGGNTVQAQINCAHMQDRVLSSSAPVESVSISKTQNSMADSIQFLPYFLERAITCYLGNSTPMCGDRTDMHTCIYSGCHFQHSLTYTFEIELKLPVEDAESIKATMLVSHRYKDFVLKLKSGSSLEFDAVFVDGMGSDHLTLQALSLGAFGENTRHSDKEKQIEVKRSMWSVFLRSIKDSTAIILELFFGYAV